MGHDRRTVAGYAPQTPARIDTARGLTCRGLARSGWDLDSDRWKFGNDKDDTVLEDLHELRATDHPSRQATPVPGAAVSPAGARLALRTTPKEGEGR
jgi:hypothetical protein